MVHSKKSSYSRNEEKAIIRSYAFGAYIAIVSLLAYVATWLFQDESALKAINNTYSGVNGWSIVAATVSGLIWTCTVFVPVWLLKSKRSTYTLSLLVLLGAFVTFLWVREVWQFRTLTQYDDFERFEFYGVLPVFPIMFFGVFSYLFVLYAAVFGLLFFYRRWKHAK